MSEADLLSALMVSIPVNKFVEAIVSVVEDEVTKKRDETRLMEGFLRAERAELEAKERERSMLLREKDRMLAVKEAGDKLVTEFLKADDGNKNFDEKAMMDAIEALIGRGGGNGSYIAGVGGVYGKKIRKKKNKFFQTKPVELIGQETGGTINYLQNTQNLDDDGNVMATIEGTNGDEE